MYVSLCACRIQGVLLIAGYFSQKTPPPGGTTLDPHGTGLPTTSSGGRSLGSESDCVPGEGPPGSFDNEGPGLENSLLVKFTGIHLRLGTQESFRD